MSKEKNTILVVDDEENIRTGLKSILESEDFNVLLASNGEEAIRTINSNKVDLVILDLRMPQMNGYEFLKITSKTDPLLPLIILTGHGSLQEAVELTKIGAFDYFLKPPDIDKLLISINRALEMRKLIIEKEKLKEKVIHEQALDMIVGISESIMRIKDLVRRVASTDATVLITGESGTGKELVANAIYSLSPRRNKPFIKVNCGAIPETLLEAELFGHEKGAFTGAINRRKGRFELADGGTIFLDEIGEISPKLQVALLRIIQDKEFQRVGGEETIKVDVRIITATNKNLEEEIKKGNFREDLFYRLNIIHIYIPPLRERKEDIPILVDLFLKKYSKIHEKNITGVSDRLLELILRYNWPGNVRELQNFVESSVIISSSEVLDIENIPEQYKVKLLGPDFSGLKSLSLYSKDDEKSDRKVVIKIPTPLDEIEKTVISETLKYTNNNKSKAARLLNITRKTLLTKLKEYNIEV